VANTIRSLRKQCRICGLECAGKPRVKDQYGHYYCMDCARAHMKPGSPSITTSHLQNSQIIDHDDLHADVIAAIRAEAGVAEAEAQALDEAEQAAAQAEAEAAKAEAEAKARPEPEPAATTAYDPADDIDEADIIPLEPEDEIEDQRLKSCPVCFHRYPPEAGSCANCGFDESRGIESSRFVEKSRAPTQHRSTHQADFPCPNCGYDMSRSVSLTCPECGKPMPTRAKMTREQVSRETAREAYRKPAIQLGVGLAIMVLIGLLISGWPALIIYPLVLALQGVIGLGVFYLCCLLWIGFDAPLKLNALILLGIYAVTGATSEILSFIPIPIVAPLVTAAVFISMFMQQMEVELADAVVVLILTIFFGIVVWLWVIPPILGVLGIAM
jgi:predicted RNA-binding Zn-ribbon protein involved in translation (DUF1610 family)